MTLLTIFFIAVIILVAIGFFLGAENTLARLFGPADQGRTVFKTFKRSSLPNNSLIAPQGFCDNAKPDKVAPQYAIPASELREHMRKALTHEKHLERVHTNDPAMRERYVQRSQKMRFADTIQVEYIPLTSASSTIAMYSHVQIGIGDHNVNRNRLRRWLKRLEKYEVDQ